MDGHDVEDSARLAREDAVGRLMGICPQRTCDERRIYAEWIVDGIIAAVEARRLDGAG